MKLRFFGVRGSVPRPMNGAEIYRRLRARLNGKPLTPRDLGRFKADGTLGYGGNTSCLLLEHEGNRLILDAGTGLRGLASHYQRRPSEPVHLLLTHLHWDHIQGLPFFMPIYQAGREVHIYSAIPAAEIRRSLSVQHSAPFFPVEFHKLLSRFKFHHLGAAGTLIGAFRVDSLRLHHPQPCYSYKLSAGGKSLVHMSDTALADLAEADFANYRRFVRGAEAVVADAQFEFTAAALTYRDWGHSCSQYFVELLAGTGVPRLVLFHYNPQSGDEQIDSELRRARAYLKMWRPDVKLRIQGAIEGAVLAL